MAKYYSSTFGKISGKHGTAVAVIMKDGSTYLREYKKPSNPRTEKQQAHRAKFALSSRALVPFNPIFKETMGTTNGISTARSHAFNNAIVGEFPRFSVDYEKLMFSFGTVEKLHSASVTINEGVISLKWDYKKMYNCHANDNINLVVFNKSINQSAHLKDIAIRSDRECNVGIQDNWVDSELYLWAYVTQGEKYSDSVFVDKCGGNNGKHMSVGISRSLSGRCVYPDDKKNIDSAIQYSINQIITTFIMILSYLVGLFNEVVTETKFQNQLKTLIHKAYSNTIMYIYNTYKKISFTLNLKSTWSTTFKELYSKLYHSHITPYSLNKACNSVKINYHLPHFSLGRGPITNTNLPPATMSLNLIH